MLALFCPLPSTACAFGCVTNRSSASAAPGTSGEQIQIADSLLAAPQTPRRRDLLETAAFGEVWNYLIGRSLAEAHQESARALPVLRDRLQNLLFELRAHARQFAQLLLFADPLQIIDGCDFMVFPQQGDAFGPESLDS